MLTYHPIRRAAGQVLFRRPLEVLLSAFVVAFLARVFSPWEYPQVVDIVLFLVSAAVLFGMFVRLELVEERHRQAVWRDVLRTEDED